MDSERDNDKFSVLVIEYRDRRVHAPAMIAPGHADDCITLALGYGRRGRERRQRCRLQRRPLRGSDAPWFDRGAQVTLAPACTCSASPRTTGPRRAASRRWRWPWRTSRTRAPSSTRRIEERRGAPADHPPAPATTARSNTSGAWPSTWASARGAAPAWSPVSRRTTSRRWARTTWSRGARCSGSASIATSPATGRPRGHRAAAGLRALRDGPL